MKIAYEHYTQAEIDRLRTAIADGLLVWQIRLLFPNRTEKAIFTKVRYEKNRKFNSLNRGITLASIGDDDDDGSITDAYAISRAAANRAEDGKFQAALGAAIESGLERMPMPPRWRADCDEYRTVHFDRTAGRSFGSSPAALCAELGSR